MLDIPEFICCLKTDIDVREAEHFIYSYALNEISGTAWHNPQEKMILENWKSAFV